MIKNLLILFSLLNPSIFAKRETDRLPEIHVIDKQTNHTESGHRRGRNKTRKLKLTPTATPTSVTTAPAPAPATVTQVTHTVTVTAATVTVTQAP
jgi:hypothetical protein